MRRTIWMIGLVFLIGCASSNGGEATDSNTEAKEKPNYNSVKSNSSSAKTSQQGSDKSSKKGSNGLPKAVGPIATVGGESVPAEKFNEQIDKLANSGRVSPQMVGKIKDSLVDKVIDQFLIDQAIQKSDIEVKESEMKEHLDRLRKRYRESAKGPKKKATLDDAVAEMGVSKKDFKKSVRKSIAIRKLLKKRDIMEEPTDEELKDFYERNKKKFRQQEQVQLSQIVFKAKADDGEETWKETEQKALQVRDSIRGEDTTFEEAAKNESEGSKADKGGDLGYLPTKQIKKKLGGNFHSVITQLDDGEISEPIRSAYGWHLIKKNDTKEAKTVPLKKVKPQLKRQLRAQRMKQGLKELVSQLKDETEIQKHPENIE